MLNHKTMLTFAAVLLALVGTQAALAQTDIKKSGEKIRDIHVFKR